MVDQQPHVELRARQRRRRQRLDPRRQRRARDRDRVDADRTCRARGSSAAVPAISRVETRTTRSPRAIRNRSSAPETCRQSSSAHTRSPPRPRAQTTSAANPRAPTATVLSPSTSPVAASTAAIVCERLWVSAPSTIMTSSTSFPIRMLDARRTRLAGGAATLLSSHAGHPRPATSDTTKGSQATPADSLKESQLAARSGPSPRRRTSPTTRIQTASLEAVVESRLVSVVLLAHRGTRSRRWRAAVVRRADCLSGRLGGSGGAGRSRRVPAGCGPRSCRRSTSDGPAPCVR